MTLAVAAIVVWSLATVDTARADDITVPASALAGDSPSGPGTGLTGLYYYNNLTPVINDTTTVADFQASIKASSPGFQASFSGLRLNWTGADTASVATYMGADGASLSNAVPHAVNTSYWDMSGYINIATPGKYTFHTNSDDASFVLIGGVQVVNNGTTHGGQDRSGTATFSAPGLYPIEILYSNQDFLNNGMVSQGSGNLEYDSTVPGDGANGNHTALYPHGGAVPEAGSLTLAGLGIAGLLGYALRRRRLAV
jgi:hypothetical protein